MVRRLAAIAIFVLIAVAAVGPIRSYDFFWHLATGRWIVEHHALPIYDPFALASAHIPWINGEWLYQVALYGAESRLGLRGISGANAIFVAALFTIAFWFASRERDVGLVLLAIAESLPSTPDAFPLLYVTVAAVVILYIFWRPKREDLWRIAVFLGLAALAVQHARNQGLYFAAFPLLLPRVRFSRAPSIILMVCG